MASWCPSRGATVEDHAVDDVAPHLRRTLHARELVALLVTEGALEHEVLLGLGVTDIEGTEPGIGGLRGGQRHGIGLGHQHHGDRLIAGRGDVGIPESGLSKPIGQPGRTIRQGCRARRIRESRHSASTSSALPGVAYPPSLVSSLRAAVTVCETITVGNGTPASFVTEIVAAFAAPARTQAAVIAPNLLITMAPASSLCRQTSRTTSRPDCTPVFNTGPHLRRASPVSRHEPLPNAPAAQARPPVGPSRVRGARRPVRSRRARARTPACRARPVQRG